MTTEDGADARKLAWKVVNWVILHNFNLKGGNDVDKVDCTLERCTFATCSPCEEFISASLS
jgi:hypothetical protein